MTTRKVALTVDQFYHVYNRGTDKRIIFQDRADYNRFIDLLFLANMSRAVSIRDVRKAYNSVFEFDRPDSLVYIGAYCLMPNHFHILLRPATDNGVQTFMLKLLTGYSMYFNKRYERTGNLFQGKFKSQHAHTDEYLKYLFSYIHLNPVKLMQSDWREAGIQDINKVKKYLGGYSYSSLHDYLGDRDESKILDKDKFPKYFKDKQEVDDELLEWLKYEEIPLNQ